MLFDEFKPIVELVLNNWTALQLAVQHGMGAPGGKETAQLMAVYVTRYCVENGVVDRDDLTEVLEDLMDEEFETACHDGSPREVAALLVHLVELLRAGQRDELTQQLNNMPKCELWLCQPLAKPARLTVHGNPNDNTSSSGTDGDDDEDDEQNESPKPNDNSFASHNGGASSSAADAAPPEPMDEDSDPGWTVVKTRRKK